MGIRSLYEKERKFYNQFHRNRINNLIHAVFVPVEWFCLLHALNMCSTTLARSMACFIFVYYTYLETAFGCLVGGMNILLCILSSSLLHSLSLILPLSSQISGLLFIYLISFSVQTVVGHGAFEGNKPAFANSLTLNSIALSLLLAFNRLKHKYWWLPWGTLTFVFCYSVNTAHRRLQTWFCAIQLKGYFASLISSFF